MNGGSYNGMVAYVLHHRMEAQQIANVVLGSVPNLMKMISEKLGAK